MENKNINIEEIMAQIKQEIKDKNLTADMLSFEDVSYKKAVSAGNSASADEVAECLKYLNTRYYVQPYKELKGNPVKVFVKKVIRKLVKFYVEPVVFEQNDINANTVTVLNTLVKSSDGASADEINDRLETLELANKELISRLEKLERENSQLREMCGKQEQK